MPSSLTFISECMCGLDELMCLSKISKRVVKSNVNVVNAQCFYPFKANIETTALQGPDSRKLCKFCI